MPFFARFKIIPDKDKAALTRKLVQNGTPDFDYFYLVGLSTLMATLGLLLDSGAIVIGSMLIAPLMYPILGVSLGLVLMNQNNGLLFQRALSTLIKSLGGGLSLSVVAAFFFGTVDSYTTAEIMSRTDPNHLDLLVAIVAGSAVAYVLAKPEWGDTLPGVAIAVALIPPLATVGIGIASWNPLVIKGATMLLFLNLLGIIAISVVIFLLMDLTQQETIATSTIKQEEKKIEDENKIIAETTIINNNQTTTGSQVIREDIVVK